MIRKAAQDSKTCYVITFFLTNNFKPFLSYIRVGSLVGHKLLYLPYMQVVLQKTIHAKKHSVNLFNVSVVLPYIATYIWLQMSEYNCIIRNAARDSKTCYVIKFFFTINFKPFHSYVHVGSLVSCILIIFHHVRKEAQC